MRVGVTSLTVTGSINIRRTRSQKGRLENRSCSGLYATYCLGFVHRLWGLPRSWSICSFPACAGAAGSRACPRRWFLRGAGIRLAVEGRERLPQGPCVVVANHASYIDGIVAAAALPPEFAFVIKKEMVRVPLGEPVAPAARLGLRRAFRSAQGRLGRAPSVEARRHRAVARVLSRGHVRRNPPDRQVSGRRLCDRRALATCRSSPWLSMAPGRLLPTGDDDACAAARCASKSWASAGTGRRAPTQPRVDRRGPR